MVPYWPQKQITYCTKAVNGWIKIWIKSWINEALDFSVDVGVVTVGQLKALDGYLVCVVAMALTRVAITQWYWT